MTGDVSEAPPELAETIAGSSRAPAELAKTVAGLSRTPAELAETVSGPSKALPEVAETTSGSSRAPAESPTIAGPLLERPGLVFERAYQSLLPELLALQPSELLPVNIGVPGAVTKALGIQPALAGLEHLIVKELPTVDARLPEKLVTRALALSHAHTLFLTATQGADALPSLSAEGKERRAVLLADVRAMIQRRLIGPETIRGLKNDRGYRSLAFDLQLLVQSLRGCPTSSTGVTAARAAELCRAEEVAATILTLVGRRKQLRAGIEAAADLRKRAFTLFARAYEETRRVVVFLRWYEDDAEQLVPLLHAKRHARKNKTSPGPYRREAVGRSLPRELTGTDVV